MSTSEQQTVKRLKLTQDELKRLASKSARYHPTSYILASLAFILLSLNPLLKPHCFLQSFIIVILRGNNVQFTLTLSLTNKLPLNLLLPKTH